MLSVSPVFSCDGTRNLLWVAKAYRGPSVLYTVTATRCAPAASPGSAFSPLVTSDNDAILIETVKLAEDRSGDVVVRLYEALGGRASGHIHFAFPYDDIVETDLLEREIPAEAVSEGESEEVFVRMRPFQLVTLRARRS